MFLESNFGQRLRLLGDRRHDRQCQERSFLDQLQIPFHDLGQAFVEDAAVRQAKVGEVASDYVARFLNFMVQLCDSAYRVVVIWKFLLDHLEHLVQFNPVEAFEQGSQEGRKTEPGATLP